MRVVYNTTLIVKGHFQITRNSLKVRCKASLNLRTITESATFVDHGRKRNGTDLWYVVRESYAVETR